MLAESCSRTQLNHFLTKLRAYLANGRLTLETRPEAIYPWLPPVIDDFVRSEAGPTTTWSKIEAALKKNANDDATDADSVRPALSRCVRLPSWTPARHRAALVSIATDLDENESVKNLLLRDAFIDGQTDPGLRARLIKRAARRPFPTLDDLVDTANEFERAAFDLSRKGLTSASTSASQPVSATTRPPRVHAVSDDASSCTTYAVAPGDSSEWGEPVTSFDTPAYEESAEVYFDDDASNDASAVSSDWDETGIYCVEGGADGTFELRITHPRTQEPVALRVGASLSQAYNYIYRDVALKLGLTPVPLDHPRTVTFANISLPVRKFVEINIPIAPNGDNQRTVFRCHVLDVNNPGGAAEALRGRTLSTMFFRPAQTTASGMEQRKYPGSNEWISPGKTLRPTVGGRAAEQPSAPVVRGGGTARRSRPFQRGGAALRARGRAVGNKITFGIGPLKEHFHSSPPPIYPKWKPPSQPFNES